jgi:Ca-activated chloride channel family protein
MKPLDSELFAITFSTGFDNKLYLSSESGSTGYYYIEAKAREFRADGKARTPLNLSIVIDKSGSMSGAKLDHAKLAAKYVVDQLSAEDYVSIVEYDDKINVVSTSNRVADKQLLRKRIDAIEAGNTTNLGGGLLEGCKQVKSTYQPGFVNRVLMLSDGQANEGITSVEELQRIAKAQSLEHGISISTFGLGLDYNENLMTNLAEYGSGNYYFIENPELISEIFQKELNGLLNVVAQNAVLTVDLPANVTLEKVFGYKFEQSGNRVLIHFRDIFSTETKAVLVKFLVKGNSPELTFKATLSFNDATLSDKPGRNLEAIDILKLAESAEAFAQSFSANIKAQVVLFESNAKLEEAMEEVDNGNYEAARAKVRENAAYLQDHKELVAKSPELRVQMASNEVYSSKIEDVEHMQEADKRQMQKGSKMGNYHSRKKSS